MISGKTIEDCAQYKCILKQPAVEELINRLIQKFNIAQSAISDDRRLLAGAE